MLAAMTSLPLLGPIKARGLYDTDIQRIIQQHCERGSINEMAEVVSVALYHEALVDGRLPQPRGIRTRELVDRAADGCRHLATTYARRGVLVAKGFFPAPQLALRILGLWEADFTSVLQRSEETGGLVDGAEPDFITRSTVAAEKLRHLLSSKLQPTESGDGLILPISELEGFCVAAVRRVYTSMLKPDVAVHELMHGETPKEEEHVAAEELERAAFVGWHRAGLINARTRLLFQYHLEEERGEAFATGWYLHQLFSLLGEEKT